jgi:molecular chaperone DnaJ
MPHSQFTREGKDLYIEKTISFVTACLGGDIEVPTLEGTVDMKIPAGTQVNKTFRVKDKGMPDLHNPKRPGDLYVRVIIHVPTKLTDRQRELLKEFGKIQ